MPTPLTKPAVSAAQLEQSSLDLWLEFLRGYFDGNNHLLKGQTIQFPLCGFSTQQGAVGQPPENGQAISITWLKTSKANRRSFQAGVKTGFLKTHWTFWFRAGGNNDGDGGPKVRVKRVADLVYALLVNKKATLPLARKGIHHIDCSSPVVIADNQYSVRSMIVTGELKYETDSDS